MLRQAQGCPAWVSDGSVRKYNRALAALHAQGIAHPSDQQIKELYRSWGGLVLESEEEVEVVEPMVPDEPRIMRRGRARAAAPIEVVE